jgi:hypothetical protein
MGRLVGDLQVLMGSHIGWRGNRFACPLRLSCTEIFFASPKSPETIRKILQRVIVSIADQSKLAA